VNSVLHKFTRTIAVATKNWHEGKIMATWSNNATANMEYLKFHHQASARQIQKLRDDINFWADAVGTKKEKTFSVDKAAGEQQLPSVKAVAENHIVEEITVKE
jgi:hypothetical protein